MTCAPAQQEIDKSTGERLRGVADLVELTA
jgi:hypothetical protein